MFQTHEHELNTDKVYQDIMSSCKYGHVQFDKRQAQARNATVTREFATAICGLPFDVNDADTKYREFIETWGSVSKSWRVVLYIIIVHGFLRDY